MKTTADTAKSTAEEAKAEKTQGEIYLLGSAYNQKRDFHVLKISGKTVYSGSPTGLHLFVIQRNDLSVVFNKIYTTHSSSETTCNELANKLNSSDSSVMVTIVSDWYFDINTALSRAIARCGGTIEPVANTKRPYAFLGIPGIGYGAGIEVYNSDSADAPYAEITTKVIDGMPQGINTINKSAYLSQALGQSTSVKGGLVLSSVIAARDKAGKVHSYMSGDNSYNRTAFAAGVSNFGKSYERKNIDILHDGSAKIGNLHIEGNGNLYTEGSVRIGDLRLDGKGAFYMQDSAGVRRLQFDLSALPYLSTLRSRAEVVRTASNPDKTFRDKQRETYFFPNQIYVPQNGSEVTITGRISVTVPPYGLPPQKDENKNRAYYSPYSPEPIRKYNNASLYLTLVDRNNDTYAELGRVSVDNFPDAKGKTDKTYDSKEINTILKGVPSGYYKVKAEFYASDADWLISGEVWFLKMKSVFKNDLRQVTLGKDGLMAFYGKDKHLYINENDNSDQPFFNVRGTTDMPGVLATASVATNRRVTNAWGAKVKTTYSIYREGTGWYRVYHNVGHSVYTVSVNCHSRGVVATVETKPSNYFDIRMQRVGRDCDSGFDYVIYGKNDG